MVVTMIHPAFKHVRVARNASTSSSRAGLAPLELVLALPLLLMVMALMVVFGNATYWKVRGLNVARQAAWSQRWPRNGQFEVPPRSWPEPGNLQSNADQAYADLDPPALQHAVVRGPLPNGFNVRDELLDFSRGAEKGEAEITRTPAMLPKLGDFRFELSHPLLDDKFQYPQMGLPGNVTRRIPRIYELPKANASLSMAYSQAVSAVVNAPFQSALKTLDRDEELNDHFGHYFDFHPRVGGFCNTEVESIRDNQIERLADRIQGRSGPPRVSGVPRTMTNTFLRMYREQLAALQAQIDALQTQGGAGAGAQIAGLQASMGPIQTKIDQLTQFRSTLP